MDNIFDYLDWRGDLPFSVSPFNEIDNYIVAKIGCCDFDGIVPEDAQAVPIGEALDTYFAAVGADVRFGVLCSAKLAPLLRRLPETPRFRDLTLSGFVRRALPERTEQFSALTVSIPDGTHYVSFRGTDDTLYAWKEDCMMALRPAGRGGLSGVGGLGLRRGAARRRPFKGRQPRGVRGGKRAHGGAGAHRRHLQQRRPRL